MGSIRTYVEANPSIYSILKDTLLGEGGDLDILSEKTANCLAAAHVNGYVQDKYPSSESFDTLGGFDNTRSHSMNSVFHNLSHVENYNIANDGRVENIQVNKIFIKQV